MAVSCLAALALVGLVVDGASARDSEPLPRDAEGLEGSATTGAALPVHGVLRFGEELGGVRLGASRAEVLASWGPVFGTCRDCEEETWYFTYEEFMPEGAGVEFSAGQAQALFTLWSPAGWRSAAGLELGMSRHEVPADYLALTRVECSGYEAYVHDRGETTTVIYMYDDILWAFALMRRGERVCR